MWPALFGGSLTGAFFFALFVGIVMNYLYERKEIDSKGDAEAKEEAQPAAVVLTPEQNEHISLRATWMIAFYCSSYAAMLCGNVPTTLVVAFLWGFRPFEAGLLAGAQSITLYVGGKLWSTILKRKLISTAGALLVGPSCLMTAFLMRYGIGSDPYNANGLPLYLLSFSVGAFGVHASFVMSNVLMLQGVPKHRVGAITSLMHAAREGVHIPLPTLIFSVFTISPQSPYLMGALICLNPLIMALYWKYRQASGYTLLRKFTKMRTNTAKLAQGLVCAGSFAAASYSYSMQNLPVGIALSCTAVVCLVARSVLSIVLPRKECTQPSSLRERTRDYAHALVPNMLHSPLVCALMCCV